jgi:hypothetical protein
MSPLRARILASLIPLALLVYATPAAAQLGIRGGVNLSKFVGEDAGSESMKGMNFGASLTLLSVGPVSIGPEVYYAKKGGEFDPATATAESLEFELSYLEVPLLARFTFPLGERLSMYVGGGPVYGWNLDCTFSAATDPNAEARECGQQFSTFDTAMESADKGIVANVGLNLPVLGGFGGLHLDARLVRGLDRLIENDAEEGPDLKNQAITLMLGYYLGG